VANDNNHLPQPPHYHSEHSPEALILHRAVRKSKVEVVMLEPAQMDIAAHHFTAQYGHNGVHSSADLHLKGALQKRS
jgi:hypothetical protein